MLSRTKGVRQYAVLGLGKFGMSVARELASAGADVLAVDMIEDRVADAKEFCTYAVKADIRDPDTLRSLGLADMDGVVIAVTGDHNASIIATITAKELGVRHIVAKATDSLHSRILEKVGADKVVIPEKESGIRVARALSDGGFTTYYELSERTRLVEIAARAEWVGKSLRQLGLNSRDGVNVIALRREDGELNISPDPDKPLSRKHRLLLTIDRGELNKLLGD